MPLDKRRSIYIVCEGLATEPDYFRGICDDLMDPYELRVNIEPYEEAEEHPSDPGKLYELAELTYEAQEYQEIWIVMDSDDRDGVTAVIDKATQKGINVALSSRSFEMWVLLHFERINVPTLRTHCEVCDSNVASVCEAQCLTGRLRAGSSGVAYIPDYQKKRKYDVYGKTKNCLDTALSNAAWLRYRKSVAGQDPKANPSTNVDDLVYAITRKTRIYYTEVGVKCNIEGDREIVFIVHEDEVLIQVTNISRRTIIYNNANIRNFVKLYNSDSQEVVITEVEAIFIAPDDEKVVSVKCSHQNITLIIHEELYWTVIAEREV